VRAPFSPSDADDPRARRSFYCRSRDTACCLAWLVIGLVSLYDAYLVQRHQPVILAVERNPICAILIAWDPDDLRYFFAAKMTGTLLVLAVLLVLFLRHRRLAIPVVAGVTAFQLVLLLYLQLGWY
jgi:hypothetical protein